MDDIFRQFEPRKGVALQHQITAFLRGLILRKELKPDEKLPTLHELADCWRTNYFTVQSAITPLVRGGLVVRKPRLGSFVAASGGELEALGMYHDHTLAANPENLFSSSLHAALYGHMGAHGISCLAWFDTRVKEDRHDPLPALRRAIRDHIVQGIIGTAVSQESVPWLLKLGVPVAFVSEKADLPCSVGLDFRGMIRLAVGRLAAQGCRRIGLVTHTPKQVTDGRDGTLTPPPFHRAFRAEVEQAGLVYDERWIVAPEVDCPSGLLEHYGYDAFLQFWQETESHPDGLFVYPDVVGRGLFHAIREIDVQVPAQLKLVVHRNLEFDIVAPVPVTWVVVSIHDFAAALMSVIERQRAGETPDRILVPVRLEESGGRRDGVSAESAGAAATQFARLAGLSPNGSQL